MKGIVERGWRVTACALIFLVAFAWQSAEVYAVPKANMRQLTRGLLWSGFRNQGTQGGIMGDYSSRGAARLTYPGMGCGMMLNMAAPDYREYWGIKAGYSWWNQKQEAMNTSGGEGVWVLTKTPDGQYGISYSGTFKPTDDNVPMYYDIANSPEKDWGYDVKVPAHGKSAGMSMANWYPGASLQTDPPDIGVPYEILNFRFGQYMDADKDNRPEDIIISKWTTKNGITITRKALAWSYQGFDDFMILEVEFENTGDSDGDGAPDVNGGAGYQLNDTYFAFSNNFVVSQGAVGNQGVPGDRGGTRPNDDIYKYTDAPGYDGPADYVGLKINYQYDGDSPDTFMDDTGGPVEPTSKEIIGHPGGLKAGQLKAHQYIGMAPLAYRDEGPSHVFNENDRGKYVNPEGEQPASSRWWEVRDIRRVKTDAPNIASHSEQAIYEEFTAPVQANPGKVGAWVNAQTYGPYNLAVGDKAKIVLAYVAGSGANAFPRPGQPKYSMDIETWAILDIPLEDDVKLARLAKGLDAMVDHLEAAQFAYNNMYDLPDYPPDIDFSVRSNEDAQNELSWSDSAESSPHPDYGEPDIVGYRVFRSIWQEFGPWTLVADIPAGTSGASWNYSGGTYTWRDVNAIAGFRYFYNVRAYARPHDSWTNGISTMADLPKEVQDHFSVGLEGGYSADTERSNLVSSPYMPRTAEGDAMTKQIRVVPNPYSRSTDGYNYQSTLKIRFVGLPSKCQIRIYNFAGEIVGQIDHDDPNSGEAYWLHKERNMASLEVATGIYFWVVESKLPGSEGKKARGTFYIIR